MKLVLLALTYLQVALGEQLWYRQPGWDWATHSLPIGNGKLAASTFGGVRNDTWILNVDSLWVGGPFQNSTYRGGNPANSVAPAMRSIQQEIFRNGTGNVSGILGDMSNFGSYSVLGEFSVRLDLDDDNAGNYSRGLDLDSAVAYSTFTLASGAVIRRSYFCSSPAGVCVYSVASTGTLPDVTVSFGAGERTPPPEMAASGNELRYQGRAELPDGMQYEARARLYVAGGNCSASGSALRVAGAKELYVLIAAETNYDETKGNAAAGYTFRGPDPSAAVLRTLDDAGKKSYQQLLQEHTRDYSALNERFSLKFPDPLSSAGKPTDQLIVEYDVEVGNPYLEGLIFAYARMLLITSTRANTLPPNLQGKWAKYVQNPWGGDYHTNINLQMNLWGAEATGLSSVLDGLWRFMRETWVGRGSETAKLLYGDDAEGWVIFNALNTFGHTGLNGNGDQAAALWFDYSASNAWMMQHVWDHYDYTRDGDWYANIGYPLLKGVAQFHLSTLLMDAYHRDGTLVVNPCNSPEQPPSTFACSINQQQIFEVFNNLLKGWDVSGDTDTEFKRRVEVALQKLDRGVHVGRYNQIQEWKLDIDDPADQHRHISQLYGWYPGYAISSLSASNSSYSNSSYSNSSYSNSSYSNSSYSNSSYSNSSFSPSSIPRAVETTLIHRGPGGWSDGNAGWGKVWRAASWAGLGNATQAYYQLRFAVQQNFAENLFSMYNKGSAFGTWVFQIDANFGFEGAVLHMFVHDRDVEIGDWEKARTVVLAPAVPQAWFGSCIDGYRLRQGGIISFDVDKSGNVKNLVLKGRSSSAPKLRFVDAEGREIVAGYSG